MDTTPTTYYRVVDLNSCGQILANRIPTPAQAQHVLELLYKDFPDSDLVIEKYTQAR